MQYGNAVIMHVYCYFHCNFSKILPCFVQYQACAIVVNRRSTVPDTAAEPENCYFIREGTMDVKWQPRRGLQGGDLSHPQSTKLSIGERRELPIGMWGRIKNPSRKISLAYYMRYFMRSTVGPVRILVHFGSWQSRTTEPKIL